MQQKTIIYYCWDNCRLRGDHWEHCFDNIP